MQLLFFSFLLRFLFYGTRRGAVMGRFLGLWVFWSGWSCLHRGGFVYIGVVLFYIGAVLFTSGWFVYIGVVLFTSGRQNGDMWHRYDAVLQQIAVMKQ